MHHNDSAVASGKLIDLIFEGSTLKDLQDIPQQKQVDFNNSLFAMQNGMEPLVDSASLHLQKGLSAVELKINGRPAYRCVVTQLDGKIYVVYAGPKTAQGTDRRLIETVTQRIRAIKARLEQAKAKKK